MAPRLAVALVDVATPGNVGSVARAMKNFGLSRLLLVDPPPLDREGEAYGFAGRARGDVLKERREVTFDELVERHHTVGFTAIPNEDASRHVRYPVLTPRELAGTLAPLGPSTDVALVFGRERIGLTNEELARLDRVCTIPASASYPTLNVAQAATVALYELRSVAGAPDQLPEDRHERADEREIERLYDRFDRLLDAIEYPPEKHDKTLRMARRVLGRADPTGREVRTAHGILRRLERRLGE